MQLQPPEKPRDVPHFQDREYYSRNFLKLLQDSDVVDIVAETEATYGTGKTTIFSSLYEEVKSAGYHAIWLSLSLCSIDYLNPDLSRRERKRGNLRQSPAVHAQNYVGYHTLIQGLCQTELRDESLSRKLTQNSLSILSRIAEAHLDGSIEQWQAVVPLVDTQPGAIQPHEFLNAIDTAVTEITQSYLERFNRLQDMRRAVLFADDYCWIYDQPIGDWVINRLSNRMKNTVLFVSHTGLEGQEIESIINQERSVKPLRLTNFTPEEVGKYLEDRLPKLREKRPALFETLPDTAYHFSRGHAQTVCLIADLYEHFLKDDEDGDLDNLPNLVPRDAAEPDSLVFELVQRLISETRDPFLQEALKYAGLTRRFDGELIHGVLLNNASYKADFENKVASRAGLEPDKIDLDADEIPADVRAAASHVKQAVIDEMLVKLERFSFINHYTDEKTGSYFAFHFFVQGCLMAWLSENESEDKESEHSQRHATIAGYYKGILEGYEDREGSNYVKCYRYEDREWQLNMSEWLYHLSFQKDRLQAQRDFVSLYFGTLQWWHWYIPFEFSQHMVTMWETTQLKDDTVIVWIKEFDQHYPHGYFSEKRGHPGWPVVIDVYEKLMAYFKLDAFDERAIREEMVESERTNLTNLLEQYGMAHRFWPRDPHYEKAEEIWKRAIEIAKIDEDEFSLSYFWVYLSHMYLELGRLEDAEDAAGRLDDFESIGDFRNFVEDTDCEVWSLAYLLRAIIALRKGRWQKVQQYSLAMTLCAYAQNFGGAKARPDPYTVSWQHDVCNDLFQHLIEAWQSGHAAEVEAVITYVYDGWAHFRELARIEAPAIDVVQTLQTGDKKALEQFLLPPKIRHDDAMWNDPNYRDTWITNLRQALASVDIQEQS